MEMINEKKDYLKGSLAGGVLSGIISALPFLSAANCCCCAGIIGGGIFSVYFVGRFNETRVEKSDVLIIGIYTGVFAALSALIIELLMNYALYSTPFAGSIIYSQLEKYSELIGKIDPSQQEAFNEMIGKLKNVMDTAGDGDLNITLNTGIVFTKFLISAVINIIFSIAGASLGVKLLFKDEVSNEDRPANI